MLLFIVFTCRFILCGHIVLSFDATSLDHSRVVRGRTCSVSILFHDVIPGECGKIYLLEAIFVWVTSLIDGLIEASHCGQRHTFLDLLVLLMMTIAEELGLGVLRLEFVARPPKLLGESLNLTA